MRSIYKIFLMAMTAIATTATAQSKLTVTSSSFSANGIIPAKYTCQGQQVSPPLQISGMPSGTKSLAIILHDPDAAMPGGFTHWVVWNLPTDGNIAEDFKGADQGLNGARQSGYTGMCPPSGIHHYHFMVYALDANLRLDKASTNKAALESAMAGHILAQGDLVGLYQKK
ncbi:MAG TPA: YbhB/YbcL family Raf kinase inhibitor-like protein [Mucilaginibacter sp.]|nr:YbhB/YbcL family Raf kinase inhibitor-like protein [Mucilaginibacter sp.]